MTEPGCDFTDLVSDRMRSIDADDGTAVRTLRKTMQTFVVPTDRHAVWWNSKAWRNAGVWDQRTRQRVDRLARSIEGGPRNDRGWVRISRADVFARAEADPVDLFLAAMAWGYGARGYGWRRTADIIVAVGEDAVAGAVNRLRAAAGEDGPQGAWRAWSRGGTAKLRGLDTAFASKVAYFACYDRVSGTGPLIADQNTAWALWALAGIWDSRARQTTYGRYIETAGRWAGELGCRSDDIERALFTMGSHMRGTWQRLNR